MTHLTDATDTHVQGVRVAASPVQDLGCQLHDHVLSPRLALEGTGGGGVIVPWQPLVVAALILDIIVGRALLGPEVLCVRRAVLEAERKATRTSPTETGHRKLLHSPPSCETRPYLPLSCESPRSLRFFFFLNSKLNLWL